MQLSAAGLALLKTSEGFRAATYKDVNGFPTIGYGHRLLAHESFPAGIDEAKAATLLQGDVWVAVQAVSRMVHVPLTQGQFDALVNFVYNVGSGRLAGSTLLADLNAKQYAVAGEQLLRWDIAAGKVNAGLKTRREAEYQLWTAPTVPDPVQPQPTPAAPVAATKG
jgi:lysozyme